MIFVTIGNQEPFDRLIKAIDEIAPLLNGIPVIAQVGKTHYTAKNIEAIEFITPSKFNSYFSRASLIVSHAGMGTIISALQENKPIIVLPRLEKYKEHRNDHQLATAKRLEELNYVHVAFDEIELRNKLLSVTGRELSCLHSIGKSASVKLTSSIQYFISA